MTEQLEKEGTVQAPGKVIYKAKTRTTGRRDNGASRSSDGRLEVKLSQPGSPRPGTNPEQLFATGWSACFESALQHAARRRKITLPEVAIDAEERRISRITWTRAEEINAALVGFFA